MMRILRWARIGLAGLLAVVAVVAVSGFVVSEAMVRWPRAKATGVAHAAIDAAAVERGRKIAEVNGCHGCHGRRFQGSLFHDEPLLLRGWAPNLTLAAARQSDAELDAAIRAGVGVDGRKLWIMPSNAFAHLSDEEAGDLLGYLRTFQPTGVEQPRFQLGPLARIGVLIGKFMSEFDRIVRSRGQAPVDLGPEYAVGRSLSRACIECHGAALKGGDMVAAPDLMVAAAYTPADFERLLRTGEATGGRTLPLMSAMGPRRLRSWSRAQIAALHAYLRARAAHDARQAEAGGSSR